MIVAGIMLIVSGVSVVIGVAIGRFVCWQNKIRLQFWKRGDRNEPD